MLHLHLYLSKRWWLLSLRSTADGVRPRHQLVDGAKLRARERAKERTRTCADGERASEAPFGVGKQSAALHAVHGRRTIKLEA